MKKLPFAVLAAGSLTFFIGTSDAEASTTYKVQAGDSLWKIARNHQVTVADLKSWNQLSSDLIHPQQILTIAGQTDKPNNSTTSSTSNQQTAPAAQQTRHVVQSGDTLSAIAVKYGTTVGLIQELNQISSHLIYPGQSLALYRSGSTEQAKPETNPTPPASQVVPTSDIYIVKRGDTLSGIAHKHGISLTQLKNWNGITSHLIYVNQRLKVTNAVVETQPNKPPTVAKPPVQSSDQTIQKMIDHALSLQGIPYVWGGSTVNGFDCSGYIHYVYKQAGYSVPRTNTIGLDARSYEVSEPKVGDLVFFKNTYRSGISHVGIYIGNSQFVHAGGDRVQISSVHDSYWKKHFDSYKRLYAMD